ncbi:MAG: hypothetical protein FJX23_03550 [Alphaproteobacteria bacterium]|nr:hypothetical protein [Alphaproteobacteria bacterium]
MDSLDLGRGFALRLAAAYVISLVLGAAIGLIVGFPLMGLEEGPQENMQEVILLCATATFAFAAKGLKDAARMTAVGAAFLCVIFYFRELELPVTGAFTAYLDSNTFRWHETFVLLAILIPYTFINRRFIPAQWGYIRSGKCWPFLLAGVWMLAGDALDKIAQGAAVGFFEEWAELNGYLTLLLVAYAFSKNARTESSITST